MCSGRAAAARRRPLSLQARYERAYGLSVRVVTGMLASGRLRPGRLALGGDCPRRATLRPMARRRLDTVLTERGLAATRSAAAASVRAGLVRVGAGGERALKPGQLVADDVELKLDQSRSYVSRGGLKLDSALEELGVEPAGRDCLDVGASTGGFSDCLLRRGARRVAAVDVGRGQLDWKLRNDRRVTVLEGINARHLKRGDLPFTADLAAIDVSFIGLGKVLGAVAEVAAPGASILAMVKPQFELGPERFGNGGVVRDPEARAEAVASVAGIAARLGLAPAGVAAAGIAGPKGNREVFLHLRRGEEMAGFERRLDQVVR
jgi:23S rRNA (cytidine1920-2'-O)/16S rRNA (cytidine1409-2'-O)-methyltransferase